MNKLIVKYIVDVGMGLSFLAVFITGIFKFPGIREHLPFIYEIIPRQQMATIHDWSGIAMGLFVLIHLILNWDWIVATTKGFFIKNGK